MDVLISGAGIARADDRVLASPLRLQPDHRRASAVSGHGWYKIDVRGTALDVLRRMDAHDAVVEGVRGCVAPSWSIAVATSSAR